MSIDDDISMQAYHADRGYFAIHVLRHRSTKAVYFKRFIEELERQGADLSQVKVGSTEVSKARASQKG